MPTTFHNDNLNYDGLLYHNTTAGYKEESMIETIQNNTDEIGIYLADLKSDESRDIEYTNSDNVFRENLNTLFTEQQKADEEIQEGKVFEEMVINSIHQRQNYSAKYDGGGIRLQQKIAFDEMIQPIDTAVEEPKK